MSFVIEGGAAVSDVRFDGTLLSFVSARAYAPGAPLVLAGAEALAGIRVEAKTIGSRRRADGRFDVRARPLNLRREDRARLLGT